MTEFINTEIYNDQSFAEASRHWSNSSINSLFDVNGDGQTSRLEWDRAQSVGFLNELSSINPLVAKSFTDESFALTTGAYLTKSQYTANLKFDELIEKWVKFDEEQKYLETRIPHQVLNIEKSELDTNNLEEDLIGRRYLEQTEIDNDA